MDIPEFFAGEGEMAQLMRTFDWSQTSLGPPNEWPQSLKTSVRIVLTSRFSMWLGWGPDLNFFYNDAYRHDTLGLKHPWALGKKVSEVWAEVWPDLAPRVDTVMNSGVATWDEALLLFLQRSGFTEETYHTFSYSPLADDHGVVSGILCVVTEETARVIGERRLELLRDLGDRVSGATTEPDVLKAIQDSLGSHPQDVPFSLIYLFDNSDSTAKLAGCTGTTPNSDIAPEQINVDATDPDWPAVELLLQTKPILLDNLGARFSEISTDPWNLAPRQAVAVPIPEQGSDRSAGFLIVGINPYRPLDSAYSGFIELLVGQIAGAIATARSYEAERKRAEELAKLDQAKTTFFSNVSHELRTPLTLMLGPLEDILASPQEISDRSLHGVELAHRNSVRLLKLVNTLLDFSRLEAGRVQANYEFVDLSGLTAEMASSFRSACQQAGLDLIVNCPPLPELVCVDRGMWEKIVLNLVSNALKFTFRGEIEVAVVEEEGSAVLRVRDTGTGISEESIPRLFERFYRVEGATGRTHEGTGIGLALVQELVKLHHGTVTVSSKLGVGTTFEVSVPLGQDHLPHERLARSSSDSDRELNLPLLSRAAIAEAFVGEAEQWLRTTAPVDPGSSQSTDTGSKAGASTPRRSEILIADDNADLREYLECLLSDTYSVRLASNGAEALDLANVNPPDLIITDVMMPILDGFELVRAVRQSEDLREIPIVMLSARAGEEAKVDGLQAGADDYLVKPFSARELLARVKSNIELAHLRKLSRLREESLRRNAEASYRRMKEFAESLPQMAAERDSAGTVRWTNERFAEYTGMQLETLTSEQAQTLMNPEDWQRFERQWARSLATGQILSFEAKLRRHDGVWRWWLLTTTPVTDASGKVERVYLSATDINEHKEVEQELEQRVEERTAELVAANREMEGFTYTVSHDLRSPLRSIIFNSAVLIDELGTKLSDEHKQLLNRQMRSAKRLAQLIDDLLKLSRVSRQELETCPVDVSELASQVLEQLHLSDEKKATVHIQPGLTAIADNQLLQFVYLNLLENACKFSPLGGEIEVGQQENVYFVRDSGIGFDQAYANKVFQPFERLVSDEEFPGTGVGLANVKRIVERHGGAVWVRSEPGQGATFYFTLGEHPPQSNPPSRN
jgi:PAS domain S-box-containing protein